MSLRREKRREERGELSCKSFVRVSSGSCIHKVLLPPIGINVDDLVQICTKLVQNYR
jgi:hypothetical protein